MEEKWESCAVSPILDDMFETEQSRCSFVAACFDRGDAKREAKGRRWHVLPLIANSSQSVGIGQR